MKKKIWTVPSWEELRECVIWALFLPYCRSKTAFHFLRPLLVANLQFNFNFFVCRPANHNTHSKLHRNYTHSHTPSPQFAFDYK